VEIRLKVRIWTLAREIKRSVLDVITNGSCSVTIGMMAERLSSRKRFAASTKSATTHTC